MKIRLRHLVSDTDRNGNVRFYVRMPGRKKIRIYGTPLTNDFMRAYHEAISRADCDIPQAGEYKPGSFRHLCIQYFSSHKFKSNDPSTRSWQRRTLESISAKHGAKPVAMMASRHVRKIRNEKDGTPAAANQRMKALRAMFAWANEEEVISVNPTLGVRNIKYLSRPHHAWTEAEFAQFYARHPVGSTGEADLPHCSAHGVRSGTATALADGGATAHQIMSVTGHRTLSEVERYTQAADRPRLADHAMAKLKR